MCDCEKNNQYVVPNPEPWKTVSISLLQMFHGPVKCLLIKRIFDEYLTEQVLIDLNLLLTNYIDAKIADPETQLYYDQMPFIQERIDYIYNKRVCL